MLVVTEQDAGRAHVRSFQTRDAIEIANWVETREQLRWVAPSTELPLTPAKVAEWKKPGGEAFVLVLGDQSEPIAYGELNPMRNAPHDLWLGHLIVRPNQRGQGMGQTLLTRLLELAFGRYAAKRVLLVVFPDNVAAIECYRRVGFQVIREEQHRFGDTGPRHKLLRLEIHAKDVTVAAGVAGRSIERVAE